MANKYRGEYAWTVGGESYTVAFTVNALCVAEEKLGKPTSAILVEIEREISLVMLRDLLWCGLQESHPNLKPADVAAMASEYGIIPAIGVLREALRAAFPELVQKPGEGEAPEGGTG